MLPSIEILKLNFVGVPMILSIFYYFKLGSLRLSIEKLCKNAWNLCLQGGIRAIKRRSG